MILDDDHREAVMRPVCVIPYGRLVANADHYDGVIVSVTGYIFRNEFRNEYKGLSLMPNPEYVRRGMEGEEIDLRGGATSDTRLTELRARPKWDLCGPITVTGRFDRKWMGLESHGFVLGEIWVLGPIHPSSFLHRTDEDVDDEPYRCVPLLRRGPNPNPAGAAPAPVPGE